MKTQQIDGAAGLRNDVSTERFSSGDLLVASNVDIDKTGRVSRRAGTQRLSAGATHSLWSNEKLALFARNGTLYRLHPSGQEQALRSGVGRYVAYADVNGAAYCSDGTSSFIIGEDGVARQWGVAPPSGSWATLSVIAGALPKGSYGVTMVYVRRDGMESGAPRMVVRTVGDNSGLRLTSLPVSTDPDVTHKRIYATRTDGEALFAVGTVRNAVTSFNITDLAADELPLRTQFKDAAPAGRVVGFFGGRTVVASGPHIFYSDPFEFELFDRRSGFLSFDSDVTLFAPVKSGVFVGTTKEIVFLAGGELSTAEQIPVVGYGAVLGTLSYVDGAQLLKGEEQGDVPVWMSARGVCAGLPDGSFANLTGSRYQVVPAAQGAGLFKVRNGIPQYLVSLFS